MPGGKTAVRSPLAVALVAAIALLSAGCERATHANIDRWRNTEKGPVKLATALSDEDLEIDLRAHAAQALVSIGKRDEVVLIVTRLPEAERTTVVEKLLPRLWADAQLTSRMQMPTTQQIAAKDTLYDLRKQTVPAQREIIDGYLVDWLGGFYAGRSNLGFHTGEKIIRELGPRATVKLVSEARETATRPPVEGKYAVVEDKLLDGIAAGGTADGVGFLLDLVEKKVKSADQTLPVRAMTRLYLIYIDASHPDRAALVPHLDRLAALAASATQPGEVVNKSFQLIASTGMPHCIKPLASLAQHQDEVRMWEAVELGISCARVEGIVAMAEALPLGRDYERGIIQRYFWRFVVELGPNAAEPARTLLGSSSWVARISGVAILAEIGSRADAERVRSLGQDGTKLRGWFGKKGGTREPTLGSEALLVADRLEKKP
jgi:hypothetical protein